MKLMMYTKAWNQFDEEKELYFFLYSFTFQVMLLISKKHVSKHFKFIFIYFHLFNQNMGRFISSSFSLRFLLFYFFFLFFCSHNFLAFSFLFSQFPHFIFLFYDLKKIICDHFFFFDSLWITSKWSQKVWNCWTSFFIKLWFTFPFLI